MNAGRRTDSVTTGRFTARDASVACVIEPFEVKLDEAAVTDLRDRLRRTRWPEAETVGDWSQGVPLAYAQDLCRDWAEDYDFGFAARVNAFPQYRTEIDGLSIHFIHVRSRHQGALPIILTHGWPSTILLFRDVIGPLTDPTAFGGKAEDAFDVIVPSLPGFGFSDKPAERGWNAERAAQAWATRTPSTPASSGTGSRSSRSKS